MLVRHVWPLVRARVPGARLLVAGRGTDRLGLDGPGVETVGEVESAAAFLQSLSILLFPQRRGSGMKVKTLEALASGVPVVTTAAGAEGIAPNDGIVVAADPAVLADQAAGLLADAEERHRRGAAAREAFAGGFAPEPATRPLAELYARLSSR
jgi:glycosyltransferase involved in cell wall biosynthesis